MVFIAQLIVRSTCFGHHYAHHQELKIYTDGCCLWYGDFGLQVIGLVWSCRLCVRVVGIPQPERITYRDSKIKHKQEQRGTITTICRFYAIKVFINIGVTASYRRRINKGCFTTCRHYCRRWFPRSLWSKKFI